MTPEEWFGKFSDLVKGDTVSFGGLELRVYCVMSFGGCVFTRHNGEVVPWSSPLWDDAVILGKNTHWVNSVLEDDTKDPADWWKE